MKRDKLREIPLGRIKPQGWLRDQLLLQARGLTGQLEEIWGDVGPDSGWLGGDGESWERGPYYLDGLVPLAHVLDDAGLKDKARKWIEWMLASQRDDGWFGPKSNDDWWSRMVALKVLMQHADATGDDRVAPFMQRYFAYQERELAGRPFHSWAVARGQENILAILWLNDRAPDPALIDLASRILAVSVDWGSYLTDRLIAGPATHFSHLTHVVNVAMGLKSPAMRERLDGTDQRAVLENGLANLDRLHGQATGMFSGDEWLGGNTPDHGVELCAVVETMYSLEVLARAYGAGSFGDRLERVAFNALAATMTADITAHQYLQQPNQVLATIARRDWTHSTDAANTFGLEPHFGCCTANLHQGWPKLAASLWAEDEEGGLAVLAYAPCTVNGADLELEVVTNYPFDDTIVIEVRRAAAGQRRIGLRIPAWCHGATLSVNGSPVELIITDGVAEIWRDWQSGGRLSLRLPMPVRIEERLNGAISLHTGPLTLAYDPGEIWRAVPNSPGLGDWEVLPRTTWNYGLELGAEVTELPGTIERRPPAVQPFAFGQAPVWIVARGRSVPEWDIRHNSASPPPPSPITATTPPAALKLVPYGCARLRVCEFPRVEPAVFNEEAFD